MCWIGRIGLTRGVLGNKVVSDSAAFCDRDVALGPRAMIFGKRPGTAALESKIAEEKVGKRRRRSGQELGRRKLGLGGIEWVCTASMERTLQAPTERRACKRGPGGCLYGEGGVIGARSDVIAGGDWAATTNVQGTADEGACEKRGPRRAPSCQIDNVQAPISVQDGPRQDWA